jgi:formate hydrogenlyase subunit 3/multisubunit Na+/H+ antiporter MnhD subunit
MIEPPLWLVILPLLAAPLVYLTRHSWFGAYLAALVSLFAGLLAASLPTTNAMRLEGRTFVLDPLAQTGLAIVFIAAAILYVTGWRFRHGRYFLPLGLVVCSLFAVAGMSRHLAITALVMTLAAVVSVPIIQGEQTTSVRGAWRFLAMMFLALPFFLLAAWRVDAYGDDAQSAVYMAEAALLVGIGFMFWLAAVPLHGWLTGLSAQAPPVGGVLLLIGFPMMALITLVHLLAEAAWFTWWTPTAQALLIGGLVSVALGGLMAATQSSIRVATGYAALFDLGCLLAAFAVPGDSGAIVLYAGLVTRAVGLILIGIATAVVYEDTGQDVLGRINGTARERPLAVGAMLMGGITLVGLPIAAGFAGRWLLLHELARMDYRYVWIVMLAGVGVALFYLRAARAMLQPAVPVRRSAAAPVGWPTSVLLLLLIVATIAVGLFPGPLLRAVSLLVTLYPLPHL